MSFTWHTYIQIVIILSFWTVSNPITASPSDWKAVEKLAEDNPYIVALLNGKNEYMCTGFSISERTIVTAGSCVDPSPHFVAISAVLGDDIVGKNVLQVSHTIRHSAYSYYVSQSEPSETLMNSNIALVFVVKEVLDYFATLAVIGDFGPLQLRKKKLVVIGYGELDSGAVVLQYQEYVQKSCVNPQWYYCVCGVESSSESTYEGEFGEGGPVIIDGKVVGVAAAPCGALAMPNSNVHFNIFTIILQYYAWIADTPKTVKLQSVSVSRRNNGNHSADIFITYIYILLIINYSIN